MTAPWTPPDPPQPVAHALQAGLGACEPTLRAMSHDTLYAPYEAQSGWDAKDPKGHVFQSVAGIRYPGKEPPNALAALIAAPRAGGGCDGVQVQVYPVPVTCDAVEAAAKGGKRIADLQGVHVLLDAHKTRMFLVAGANATCVIVSVDSKYGAP
ncbi:MAG: hypothetical protein KGQ28_05020 [Hyphomicrobiales bacterium]|nr:hypothetical protein [Hyphomicrobiales bacterium]